MSHIKTHKAHTHYHHFGNASDRTVEHPWQAPYTYFPKYVLMLEKAVFVIKVLVIHECLFTFSTRLNHNYLNGSFYLFENQQQSILLRDELKMITDNLQVLEFIHITDRIGKF